MTSTVSLLNPYRIACTQPCASSGRLAGTGRNWINNRQADSTARGRPGSSEAPMPAPTHVVSRLHATRMRRCGGSLERFRSLGSECSVSITNNPSRTGTGRPLGSPQRRGLIHNQAARSLAAGSAPATIESRCIPSRRSWRSRDDGTQTPEDSAPATDGGFAMPRYDPARLPKASLSGGPQITTNRVKECAVLVPIEQWHRPRRMGKSDIKDSLLASEARMVTLPRPGQGIAFARR